MSKMNRRKFIRVTTLLPIAGALIASACETEIDPRDAVEYKILSTTKTTLTETLAPVDVTIDKMIIGSEVEAMLNAGYGKLTKEAGENHILRKDLLANPDSYVEAVARKSLLLFPQITDVHITDIEGPNRMPWAYFTGNTSAYRSHSIYCTHVLDAMIQTFSALHTKENFDFVLATGDLSDNASGIEVMWFNTIINGGIISADSGAVDNPISGGGNDFTDPYIANGLPDGLEWYAAVGNHDVLHQGINYITDEVAAGHVGDRMKKLSLMCESVEDIYAGSQTASTPYGEPICAFDKLVADDGKSAMPYVVSTGETCGDDPSIKESCKDDHIVPDERRKAFRSHKEWFDNINDADVKHPNESADKSGYYSVQPKEDIPIELIFLDLAAVKENFEKNGLFKPLVVNANAYLEEQQFNWLKDKLASLKTEKKGAIIALHHPIDLGEKSHFHKDSEISAAALIEELKKHDNLLAVIAGHTHENKLTIYKDDTNEINGFPMIVTCGLLDFPEQARIYEVVYNDNKTISIFTTMLNHASKEDSFSYVGRTLSLAGFQVGNSGKRKPGLGIIEDRNTEIIVPIPQYLQESFDSVVGAKDYLRTLKFDA